MYPPHKMDQHLSGKKWGIGPGPAPLQKSVMEEEVALLYLQFLPSPSRWQEGSLGLFLASLLPLPPQKGSQAELVKTHRLGG